jgi:hypothetical protein
LEWFWNGSGNGGGTVAGYAANVLSDALNKSNHTNKVTVQITVTFYHWAAPQNRCFEVTVTSGPERLPGDKTMFDKNSERFSGYGVMGLPFASGHALGLRWFPASSVGPGYTSVWHRNPEGRWTFYQDVPPQQACPRYFGAVISETLEREIAITWSGAHSFTVTIRNEINLHWQVSLTATPATRLMNILSGALPEGLWYNPTFLRKMGRAASLILRAGQIDLTGVTPNGQAFVVNPRKIWIIGSSTATLRGEDLGRIGPLQSQARLGDFWIPQRGIFAIGGAIFEPYNSSRHILKTSRQLTTEL